MKVAVSGANGLIGSALSSSLLQAGHQVTRIVRSRTNHAAADLLWNPEAAEIEGDKLEGVDAVVHLAGENIAARRWQPAQKEKIRLSRINGTKLLAETIRRLKNPPRVVVSGSAIGFYGNRRAQVLTEQSPPGDGFLAEVCRAWEQAIAPAREKGVRIVNLRTGVVLSTKSGALAKMLPIFRLGGGGIIGDGHQYMSWISLDDEVQAILHIIQTDTVIGPVNCVAPNPVTNAEFTQTLAKALHRPAILPLPAFAAKILLGEMADELLLASQRCQPEKLLKHGYTFQYPTLEDALRHVL